MGRNRRIAAGLCVLMLAQSLIPAEAVRAESTKETAASKERQTGREESADTSSRKAAEESAETARENLESDTAEPEDGGTKRVETTEPETTEKGNARRQTAPERETAESESRKETAPSEKEEQEASLDISVEADEERAKAEYEIKLQAPGEAVLEFTIPEGFAAEEIILEEQNGSSKTLTEGKDWELQDGAVRCRLGVTEGEYLCRVRLGLNQDQIKIYMESGEELEAELTGKAALLDPEGKVLADETLPREILRLAPFLEKEAQGQGRAQKTFVWTDWVNLGVNPGEGYLVSVIEDLEEGHHFDFEEGQVTLLDAEGSVKEQIPVTEISPQRSGAFGEIFTAEDARDLLGGISGAGFYTFEEDGEQKNGILIVPVEDGEERTGISYRTRVSASEEPDVYQWDAALECGSKFLWEPAAGSEEAAEPREEAEEASAAEAEKTGERATEADAEEASESKTEEEPAVDLSQMLHPVWEVRAERIPGEDAENEKGQNFAAKGIWLTQTASCSLASQKSGEEGYHSESGTAIWDFLINQNGENVREAVIARELPEAEQTFAGAVAEGKSLEVILSQDEIPWSEEGIQAEILPYEDWEKSRETLEESSDFYGYYVRNQENGTERLEIHLFQLGQAACRFQVETQVKDGAFAACSEDFAISSGRAEYTAVLETADGEIRQTGGECMAEIPAENSWITLEAAEGYDYEDHSLELEMTVNPQMRSLAEPQAAAVLSDGLEQVEIQQVMVRSAGGRWQDVTEDQWIAAEEAEPDERTGESQVIFSWREAEDGEEAPAEPASWQIRFRCRMSEAMRNESFLSGDEEVLFAAAELTGKTGAEGEEKEISGARSQVSIAWNSAAAAGEGAYLESRYSQEGSRWDGTRMPRVDWTVVINRNEGDLTGSLFTLQWPDALQADEASLRIYTVKLNADGSLGEERQQIWPYEETEEGEREGQPYFAENEIAAEQEKLEITLPDSVKGRTLCVELTAFVREDMEAEDFIGSYGLERGADVLEEGSLEVSVARAVSILEAAEKNQIPSAAVSLISENSESGEPYGVAGASYRLVRMDEKNEDGQWDSYEEADEGKDETAAAYAVTGEDGQAVFLFLEEDTLYKLEETEAADGYEAWENPRYLVLLDERSESDFPKEDEEHALYTAKTQILIQEKESLSRWKSGEETVKGGRLEFYVQDQEGNLLENVNCSLTYTDYEETGRGRLKSRQAVSGSDGLVVFEGLDPTAEGREGYEIHVTAPYGMEDPAEFSAGVTVEEDGTFRTVTEGKAAQQKEDGVYVTCLPAVADIRIPVTDQNGNLLTGCGLELQVERLEDAEPEESGTEVSEESKMEDPETGGPEDGKTEESKTEETVSESTESAEPETETAGETEAERSSEEEDKNAARFVSYEPMPSVAEDGSGYITLPDLPYGTYRVFGGRSIMTLILDEGGAEGWLEPVEAESERGDRKAVRLELKPDKDGVYGAGETDGWYMEEYLPRSQVRLQLEESGQEGSGISGSRFLVYETWSDRLIGELKESSQEPGVYELTESESADAVLENDRGLQYIEESSILPGTYAVWEIQPAEGYRPDGNGVWYFNAGTDTAVGNEDLYGGSGEGKPFENSVIRCQVPFRLTLEEEAAHTDSAEEESSSGTEKAAEESSREPDTVTAVLRGTAWGSKDTAGEYEAEISCNAEKSGTWEFDQVPVGIYILRIDPESAENLGVSPGIQVQVQYDGQVIFRTIGGRLLEEGELTLRRTQ